MKMKNMKSNVQIQGIGFLITVSGLLKFLWNKLFPELFGTKKITYWQSIMLYFICKALFDFRYNIKDSFNFGNNTITNDKSKKDETQAVKEERDTEEEIEDVEVEIKVEDEKQVNNEEVKEQTENK